MAGNSPWIFTIQRLAELESLNGLVLIVFTDASAPLQIETVKQAKQS
jgi:hypothetical protein